MTFQHLLIEQDRQILVITINRPDVLNAISREVLNELEAAFKQAEAAPEVRAVLLTGAGSKAFVAGADVAEIRGLDANQAANFSAFGQRLFEYIESFPKPVAAAVNGFALGGGCELAMACHFRFASATARFGLPEINLGIMPGYGGTQRLPQLIGKARALEMALTGAPISAEQALAYGLANAVHPGEELLEQTKLFLGKLCDKSPTAMQLIIDAVNAGYVNRHGGYETEVLNFSKAVDSEDGREGVGAFLDKRKPVFKGA